MTSAPTSEPNRAPRFAVFALGFRPFFLLAAGYAVVMMGLWLATLLGVLSGPVRGSSLDWHAHEMIFGVMGAVVAGFLLTAVRNWTQLPTPQGTPLALMTVLWLAGRASPWLDTVPAAVCALADTAFLATVLIAIAGPIVKTRQRQNYQFIAMLAVLLICHVLVTLGTFDLRAGPTRPAMLAAVYALVWMLVAMGGRVIPFFTERRIAGFLARRRAWLDLAAIVTVIVAGLSLAWEELRIVSGALLLSAAALNAWRWLGWQTPKLWQVPLLWVLHLGYLWLVLGLALHGVAQFQPWLTGAALHLLSVGGIVALALGMMARVSLGHTGRPLELGRPMVVALGMIFTSALVRVLAPFVFPDLTPIWLLGSGLLWMLAFGVFFVVYLPLLLAPRADGQPG
ncbi:MAG: NnrS family protein [Thiotrichales bacterium]